MLQVIAGRLEAVERAPALAMTSAHQAAELRQQLFQIAQDAPGRAGAQSGRP
jgi:hypothetical protein